MWKNYWHSAACTRIQWNGQIDFSLSITVILKRQTVKSRKFISWGAGSVPWIRYTTYLHGKTERFPLTGFKVPLIWSKEPWHLALITGILRGIRDMMHEIKGLKLVQSMLQIPVSLLPALARQIGILYRGFRNIRYRVLWLATSAPKTHIYR